MPIDIDIRLDIKRMQRDVGKMGKRVLPRAVPRAINRTLTTVNTAAKKEISAITGLKQKEITDGTSLFRARRNKWIAAINMRRARAPNLRRFVSAKQAKASSGPGNPQAFRRRSKTRAKRYLRKGVKARGWRKLKEYDGTFIAKGKSGNTVVLKREGKSRKSKVVGVVGPSPRLEFNREKLRRELNTIVRKRLPIELDREVSFAMRRELGTR